VRIDRTFIEGAIVANEEHVKPLKQVVAEWNASREETDVRPDLSGLDLSEAELT